MSVTSWLAIVGKDAVTLMVNRSGLTDGGKIVRADTRFCASSSVRLTIRAKPARSAWDRSKMLTALYSLLQDFWNSIEFEIGLGRFASQDSKPKSPFSRVAFFSMLRQPLIWQGAELPNRLRLQAALFREGLTVPRRDLEPLQVLYS